MRRRYVVLFPFGIFYSLVRVVVAFRSVGFYQVATITTGT
jgi:hypothetical protein